MRLVSVGIGYIGLPLACLFAEAGISTVGITRKIEKVEQINNGIPPFHEPGLEQLLREVLKDEVFRASTVLSDEVESADAILICVPTPLAENNTMDDMAIKSASQKIGKNLQKDQLVVVESTISPGTTEGLIKTILEKESGLSAGEHFFLAHCPERAMPGNTLFEMKYSDRVIGGIDEQSTQQAIRLYRLMVKGRIIPTTARIAETVKLAENASRDIQIAFANELALLCDKQGVDVFKVIELANRHPRVSILCPGVGVGGHCLPIDPWFLIEKASNAILIPSARQVNNAMPKHIAQLAISAVKHRRKLSKSKFSIFGLSYKADVDDIRETPAKNLVEQLRQYGADVVGFDPYVSSCDFVGLIDNAVEAANDSDCIIVTVNHTRFRALNWEKIRNTMRTPILVDCSNFFYNGSPAGFEYIGFGKPRNYH